MNFRYLLLILVFCSFAQAETYLSPLDFGLSLMEHGMVDYCNTPDNIQCGNYNSDCYPDIARFNGNKLEIFLFMGKGYTPEPQQSRIFMQPIKSLTFDDNIWDSIDNLVVTFEDNSEKTFCHNGGCLDLSGTPKSQSKPEIPRRVSEADFEIVWESEPRPYGMDRCAVGDLDNDGINELVTWWKEEYYSLDAWILIYKSIGDDEYELFMEEPFYTIEAPHPILSQLLITDLDQNGQKELIYTREYTYIWEFSAPGEYIPWNCSIHFSRAVVDVEVCDVDQDNILELAFVTSNYELTPPTMYQVEEFSNKSPYPWHSYGFTPIWSTWQDWVDNRLAVGDFDNDGAVDIVSGNFGSVGSYDPIDIQFFRYDSAGPPYFQQQWLHTGLPLSCATPVIADMDMVIDGENELFAAGLFPNGGSAFIWESTGFGTGYASWQDTTNLIYGPHESVLGIIDDTPSIMTTVIYFQNQNNTLLRLFGLENSHYRCLWRSASLDSVAYYNSLFIDIDQDGKDNFITGSWVYDFMTPNKIFDWEQTSSGVFINPGYTKVHSFTLHRNYPNPFNSSTVIPFELSKPSDIRLSIYDIYGRIVHEHRENNLAPGHYSVDWRASDLSSGIYIIKLIAKGEKQIIKGVLMK